MPEPGNVESVGSDSIGSKNRLGQQSGLGQNRSVVKWYPTTDLMQIEGFDLSRKR